MDRTYVVEAIDRSGNILTGYQEVLQGISAEDVIEKWRYHNIYIADPRMCSVCGEDMEWEDGEYICPDCGHHEFFDGRAEAI